MTNLWKFRSNSQRENKRT